MPRLHSSYLSCVKLSATWKHFSLLSIEKVLLLHSIIVASHTSYVYGHETRLNENFIRDGQRQRSSITVARELKCLGWVCANEKIKNKKIVRKLCKMQCKKNIAWRTAAANSDKFTPFTLRKQDCRVFFWCVQPKIGRMCRQIVQIQDLVTVAPTRQITINTTLMTMKKN